MCYLQRRTGNLRRNKCLPEGPKPQFGGEARRGQGDGDTHGLPDGGGDQVDWDAQGLSAGVRAMGTPVGCPLAARWGRGSGGRGCPWAACWGRGSGQRGRPGSARWAMGSGERGRPWSLSIFLHEQTQAPPQSSLHRLLSGGQLLPISTVTPKLQDLRQSNPHEIDGH